MRSNFHSFNQLHSTHSQYLSKLFENHKALYKCAALSLALLYAGKRLKAAPTQASVSPIPAGADLGSDACRRGFHSIACSSPWDPNHIWLHPGHQAFQPDKRNLRTKASIYACCGGQMMPSAKDIHALTRGTCEYIITLHSKRDFADVIQVKALKWRGYPRFPGEPDLTTRVHKSGEPSLAVVRGRRDNRERVTQMRQRWF